MCCMLLFYEVDMPPHPLLRLGSATRFKPLPALAETQKPNTPGMGLR